MGRGRFGDLRTLRLINQVQSVHVEGEQPETAVVNAAAARRQRLAGQRGWVSTFGTTAIS